jgi:hypothetical protein
VDLHKRDEHYYIAIQDGLCHNHTLRPPHIADLIGQPDLEQTVRRSTPRVIAIQRTYIVRASLTNHPFGSGLSS